MASELERILKLTRRHLSRRRLGFRDSHSVHEGRLREFCAAHEPKLPTSGGPHRFTVVLTCYNHAHYLPSAFASIAAQTVPPNEIILIDDRSTDDTWRVVQDLAGASGLAPETLRTLRNERNLGQCATINAAVARATSDVIVVLNDDDYLMHDALDWIGRVLAAHSTAALVGARAVTVASQAYLDNLRKSVAELVVSNDFTVRMSDPSEARAFTSARQLDMCHSGSAFLKEAWQAVGGYYAERGRRIVLFSDRDFQLRVNCLYPVALVEDAPFAFWRTGSSVDRGLFT